MLLKNDELTHISCPFGEIWSNGTIWNLHCKAAGPRHLDSSPDPGELIDRWCSPCSIPDELSTEKRPCLYLIPVRFRSNSHPIYTFSCRWFFKLTGKKVIKETWKLCGGCPHWFPRPPDENLIPNQEEWAEKVIRIFEGLSE